MQEPDQMISSRQEITEMITPGGKDTFTTTSSYFKETMVETTQICLCAWRQWQLGNDTVGLGM